MERRSLTLDVPASPTLATHLGLYTESALRDIVGGPSELALAALYFSLANLRCFHVGHSQQLMTVLPVKILRAVLHV